MAKKWAQTKAGKSCAPFSVGANLRATAANSRSHQGARRRAQVRARRSNGEEDSSATTRAVISHSFKLAYTLKLDQELDIELVLRAVCRSSCIFHSFISAWLRKLLDRKFGSAGPGGSAITRCSLAQIRNLA